MSSRLLGIAVAVAGCSWQPSATSQDADTDATTDGPMADTSVVPSLGPHGVYVPTFGAATSDPALQGALASASVDGLFVVRYWKDVESAGTFDFETTLGADLRAVAAAHKHATIAIGAGINAPSDLCTTSGAVCLPLVIHFKQGAMQCVNELLPLPWDPVVQQRFGALIAALGTYVASDPVLAATVIGVKITGFNDHDAETILPNQSATIDPCTTGDACQSDGTCHDSDTVVALAAAGYTPDVATTAFLLFADEFRAAFPRLPIGSQITKILPAPGLQALPVAMVQQLTGDAARLPVTVQDNGLTAVGGIDSGTVAAHAAGVPIGFQTLASVANNAQCLMGMHAAADGSNLPCTESLLRTAIDNGITNGATWLELYKQDVAAYPDTIAYAHAQLVR